MTKSLCFSVLLAATALAGPAYAQEPAPKPAPPGQPAPAPTGQPADLCQELLAFVKPPEPASPPATTPVAPQQQTAVSAPNNKADEKAGGAAGGVQQNSGLSGPIPKEASIAPKDAPAAADPGAKAPASPADARAAANAGAKAPTPPAAAAPPTKPSPEDVAQAEAAVGANDPAACRAAVQTMRRAGVTVPSPLLALAALDLKLFAPR
jgi:hypothetical protein